MLANSVDPDQTPHNVASDLGLHCLFMSILQVFRTEEMIYDFRLWMLLPLQLSVSVSFNTNHPYDLNRMLLQCTTFNLHPYFRKPILEKWLQVLIFL